MVKKELRSSYLGDPGRMFSCQHNTVGLTPKSMFLLFERYAHIIAFASDSGCSWTVFSPMLSALLG